MRNRTTMPRPLREERSSASTVSRRSFLKELAATTLATSTVMTLSAHEGRAISSSRARPWLKVRGVYGGFPQEIFDRGETPTDYGINAIWVGSGSLDASQID